jgi:acetoin utilization protein AcuB
MFVSMWMTRDVLTITPDATLVEMATLMMRRRIRRLPVVSAPGERGSLLGVVTHSDVLHAFPPDINPFAINAADSSQAALHRTADQPPPA